MSIRSRTVVAVAGFAILVAAASARQADLLTGLSLVTTLRQGGLVFVMRHASSPAALPDRATAHPDNLTFERQLSEAGRSGSDAMGRAIRALGIPIAEVLSSPTFRALETVRHIGVGSPTVVDSLGDGGQGMQPVGEAAFLALRTRAAAPPTVGTSTLIVSHSPNIAGAFPAITPGVAEGEFLVFRADGRGGSVLVARIRIDQWPSLAAGG